MHHIAQINIARMHGVNINDPIMQEFVDNLEPVNQLADISPGFVWRFKEEGGDATAFNPYGDERIIINWSVWETVEQLEDFVYNSFHTEIMKKQRQWFEKLGRPHYVIWYIPKGHIPTFEEANERLEYLDAHEPSPHAFNFRAKFPIPDAL
jgi:hypothetical protein